VFSLWIDLQNKIRQYYTEIETDEDKDRETQTVTEIDTGRDRQIQK